MSHICHAERCTVKVPPKMHMCKKHWFMVPKRFRDWIWLTYRPGQENDKQPSDLYMNAYHLSVGSVAEKEGRENPFASSKEEDIRILDDEFRLA